DHSLIERGSDCRRDRATFADQAGARFQMETALCETPAIRVVGYSEKRKPRQVRRADRKTCAGVAPATAAGRSHAVERKTAGGIARRRKPGASVAHLTA